MSLLFVFILSYFLGSIPFGLILTKFAGLGDIRAIGSGNIGATNVLRTGNKKLAAATLLLDGFKGALAVLLVKAFVGGNAVYFAGFAAFIGHLYPLWLGFKGGKGVATGLGVLLAISFPVGALACLVWLGVAFALRYSSVAALAAFASAPLLALLDGRNIKLAVLAVLLAVLVAGKHRANIARLSAGAEPKIGKKP